MADGLATYRLEVECDFVLPAGADGPAAQDAAYAAQYEAVDRLQQAVREHGFAIARTGYGVRRMGGAERVETDG